MVKNEATGLPNPPPYPARASRFDAPSTKPVTPAGGAKGQAATELIVPLSLHDQLIRHVRRCLPNEGCGLLAGSRTVGAAVARRFFAGTNVDRSPTRFTMDPREVLAALTEIDRLDLALLAVVHSHPSGPATPSLTDLVEASYPHALLLIIALDAECPNLRAWRCDVSLSDRSHPVEVSVQIVSENDEHR